MLKKDLFLLFFSAMSLVSTAQEFRWVQQISGLNGSREGRDLVIDDEGSIIFTGIFGDTTDFDPGRPTHTLISQGARDIFVCKLDSAGDFVWASQFAGSSINLGNGIAVDDSGNAYVVGTFQSTVDFDPDTSVFNLTAYGGHDAFVAKLNPSGSLLWAKQYGGQGDDSGVEITVDKKGDVIFTGKFVGTAEFDPSINQIRLNSAGAADIYLAKINPSGKSLWAKGFGGSQTDIGFSVGEGLDGHYFLTGQFRSVADFDPSISTHNLYSMGDDDICVVKLDSTGNMVWAKSFGGSGEDYGNSVVGDSFGHPIIAGLFSRNANFDSDTTTLELKSSGQLDIFELKLTPEGNLDWIHGAGGSGVDVARSLEVDIHNNVYTSGFFNGFAKFGDDIDTVLVGSSGREDIYISQRNPSGSLNWVVEFGGREGDLSQGLAVDKQGAVLTTGYFRGTVDFDPSSGTVLKYSDQISRDIFVHKMVQLRFSISENTFKSTISVYPNPAKDGIVTVGFNNSYQFITAILNNINGQKIATRNFQNVSQFEMEIQGSAGIYFLEIQAENGECAVIKVVK